MRCPNCNKVIKKTDTRCRFCNEKISQKEKEIKKTNEKKIIDNKLLIYSIIILYVLVLSQYVVNYINLKNQEKNIIILPALPDLKSIKSYRGNETFTFDNLEITVGNNYSFTTLNNKYSRYNGRKVIKIPVTIKNTLDKDYNLNLYYYSLYDYKGEEIDEVAAYFNDGLFYADNLKPGESYTKYLYILYEKDGTYIIKFNKKEEKVVVFFDVYDIKYNSNEEKNENVTFDT